MTLNKQYYLLIAAILTVFEVGIYVLPVTSDFLLADILIVFCLFIIGLPLSIAMLIWMLRKKQRARLGWDLLIPVSTVYLSWIFFYGHEASSNVSVDEVPWWIIVLSQLPLALITGCIALLVCLAFGRDTHATPRLDPY